MIKQKITLIGVGNLGSAIASGLIQSKQLTSGALALCDLNNKLLAPFKNKGVSIFSDPAKAIKNADIIIVAVKPQHVKSVLAEIKSSIDPKKQLLLCTAAGVTIADIREQLGNAIAVVRVMPNTAMKIHTSMTCFAADKANNTQKASVKSIFDLLGETIEIPEHLMSPATILGASGIAFALRYIRAAMQAGVEMGFEHDTALKIVTQTVKGASGLLLDNGSHPEEEIDHVTTPGGVTITGLNEMEHKGFTAALIQGIIKANNKTIRK